MAGGKKWSVLCVARNGLALIMWVVFYVFKEFAYQWLAGQGHSSFIWLLNGLSPLGTVIPVLLALWV